MSTSLRRWIAIKKQKKLVRRKLWALAGYVKEKVPEANAEEVMKLVMIADFEAYAHLGRPITGVAWIRDGDMPVPVYPRLRQGNGRS